MLESLLKAQPSLNMQKLELESSLYNEIIKGKTPLPTSFKPPADFVVPRFYNLLFAITIPFGGWAYKRSPFLFLFVT
jgi:hypothetical protein